MENLINVFLIWIAYPPNSMLVTRILFGAQNVCMKWIHLTIGFKHAGNKSIVNITNGM